MRKKLLALLMCATMVLSSSVVAMAAPSEDDFKNAGKVFTNSENFVNELYKENETIKETVWVQSVQTNVTFGFNDANLKAVKLNSDSKPLKYVGDYKNLAAAGSIVVCENTTTNPSATLQALVDEYVDANHLAASTTVAQAGLTKIAYLCEDTLGLKHLILASLTAGNTLSNVGTPTVVDTVSVTATTSAKVAYVNVATQATKPSAPQRVLTANYKTADGYSYDVDTKVDLFKADAKDVKGAGIKCVKYTTAKNVTLFKATVAKALEKGTLTKDAVAVCLSAYSVTGDKEVYGSFGLTKVTTPTSGYTVTSLSDLLSRTSLKDSVNIFKFNTESPVVDYEMGTQIYPITTVDENVSIADKSFVFDVTFTGDEDVIVFDQATVADKDNAGQADADKADKPADASPKTGDVAPIAALAVVMMGAFGAMVVASKKRA